MEDALAAFRAALDARIAEREKREDLPAISDDGCQSMPSDKGQGIALDDGGELPQSSPVQVRWSAKDIRREVDTAIDVAIAAHSSVAQALEATMSENAHLRVSIARLEAQVKGMQMAMVQGSSSPPQSIPTMHTPSKEDVEKAEESLRAALLFAQENEARESVPQADTGNFGSENATTTIINGESRPRGMSILEEIDLGSSMMWATIRAI